MFGFLQVLHSVDQNVQSQETFIPDTSAAEFFVYKRRKTDIIGGDGESFAITCNKNWMSFKT